MHLASIGVSLNRRNRRSRISGAAAHRWTAYVAPASALLTSVNFVLARARKALCRAIGYCRLHISSECVAMLPMTQNVCQILYSVKSLLGGTAAFMVGNSLLGVVLSIRMEAAGYPVALTGAIIAAYGPRRSNCCAAMHACAVSSSRAHCCCRRRWRLAEGRWQPRSAS